MKNFLSRIKDPVLTDRSVDLMAALYWLCFAGWGISSTIYGLSTVSRGVTEMYQLIWGAAIGALAITASIAAFSMFFNSHTVQTRIRKKVTELVTVCLLSGLVAVYPILLATAALGGDLTRVAPLFAAASYLIFPTWRVRHLAFRIRKLRQVTTTGVSR